MKKRNPKWTKEELTLAYNTLKLIGDRKFGDNSLEIRQLSHLLNSLCIHKKENRLESFRDPNGVRGRVSYLKRIDAGNKIVGREDYKAVVKKYSSDLLLLKLDVESIISRYKRNWLPPTNTPDGNKRPKKNTSANSSYERDQSIIDWVLEFSQGICECCNKPAPFYKQKNAEPFLEVHHLRMLSDGGSDTITNTVAVCPNCHRELHHGQDKHKLLNRMYSDIYRLIVE